jgi:hypothetical protein
MLLRIFKTSQPLSWVLIVLLLLVARTSLFLSFFTEDVLVENVSNTGIFTHFLAQNYTWISHFLSLLIIIPAGFLFNKIAQDVNLFKGIHYLLFLFFGIFVSFSPSNLVLSPFLLSLPLVLLGLAMVLTQTKGQISLSNVFNASFLIGLATLLFIPNFIVFVVLVIGMFYINQITGRALLVSLMGMLTPWIFHEAILFSFAIDAISFQQTLGATFGTFSVGNFDFNRGTALLAALIFIQTPFFLIQSSKSIIKIKKPLFLMFYHLILAVFITGFFYFQSNIFLDVITIPAAIIFTSFQLEVKKWWLGDLIFIALIFSMILNYLPQ